MWYTKQNSSTDCVYTLALHFCLSLSPAGLHAAQPSWYCVYSVVQTKLIHRLCVHSGFTFLFVSITSRPACSTAVLVLCLLSGPKKGFRPTGATHCPSKCEIWHCSPMPNIMFIGAEMWEYSPKRSKFGILAINLPIRGDSFAQFLRNSQHLYASIDSF